MNQMHPTPDELVDYLHGELPAARDAVIYAHLAGCPDCTEARDAEVSLTEILRAHARAEERELPPGVAAGIREAIQQSRRPVWQRWSIGLRLALAVPAAAAIALLLYVGINGVSSWNGKSTTAIDPAYYVNSHATLSAIAPLSQDEPIPSTLASDDETR